MDTKHDEKKRRDDTSPKMLSLSPVATPDRLVLFFAIFVGDSSLGQEQLLLSPIPIAAVAVAMVCARNDAETFVFVGFIFDAALLRTAASSTTNRIYSRG
jgi:hypothetical protein